MNNLPIPDEQGTYIIQKPTESVHDAILRACPEAYDVGELNINPELAKWLGLLDNA